MRAEPKPGFARHERSSPLTRPWEPIYAKRTGAALVLGLYVDEPHLNSRGLVHGGLLACLADNAMGLSCGLNLSAPARLLTVNLTMDYLRSARPGQWLEFDTHFVKPGRALCFAQAFVTADGEICARANGVFSVVAPVSKGEDDGAKPC